MDLFFSYFFFFFFTNTHVLQNLWSRPIKRSHARHAVKSIVSIHLQGNGISSIGAKNLMILLRDASNDRFGALGHYLGFVQTVDFSNNSRMENDCGPLLINLVNDCNALHRIVLTGTTISRPLCRQLELAIEDKQERNKGVQEARDDDAKDSKSGGGLRAAALTSGGGSGDGGGGGGGGSGSGGGGGGGGATTLGIAKTTLRVQNMLKHHNTWKKNVAKQIQEKNKTKREAAELHLGQLTQLQALQVSNHDEATKRALPRQKSKAATSWQEYAAQGDLALYDEESQKKRNFLKSNVEIIAIVHHWWSEVILAKYDKNHDDQINKEEYFHLHKALGRALADPNVVTDPEIERKLAEEDWKSDTNGKDFMEEKMFGKL